MPKVYLFAIRYHFAIRNLYYDDVKKIPSCHLVGTNDCDHKAIVQYLGKVYEYYTTYKEFRMGSVSIILKL